MARILIAHQGTIPHYRLRFYELLESMRPEFWKFDVVYDPDSTDHPDSSEPAHFSFPTVSAATTNIRLLGRRLQWQHFFRRAAGYDVLITDTHISNLTYPLLTLYRLRAQRQILWGHPRNMNVSSESLSPAQHAAQKLKKIWIRTADAFFAYTESGRREVLLMGMPAERIHVLGNTIDTRREREAFRSLLPQRDAIRHGLRVQNRRVITAVGRLRPDKRIPFLLAAFRELYSQNRSWHLFVVGDGPDRPLVEEAVRELGSDAITYFGALVTESELAPILTASDFYILAGAVGLGPLQAFCYDLPALAFDVQTHGPEFDYLNETNSRVFPGETTPRDFAARMPELVEPLTSQAFKGGVYSTIRHLTLEAMAARFIEGVNSVLKHPARQ